MSDHPRPMVAAATVKQADSALRRAAARERNTLRITRGQRSALAALASRRTDDAARRRGA